MKLKPRNTHTRVTSSRITSPETRKNKATGLTELLLSYADASFNHQHSVTNKELFLFAAGNNEEGELPDGLDRLANHKFIIHLDKDKKAIGLDVIPARVYRSAVIPASQKDVENVKLIWLLGGDVCRVLQRPAGVTAPQLIELVRAFDKLAESGEEITATTKLDKIGKVVSVSGDIVEVKLRSVKSRGGAVYDTDSLLAEA